MKKFVCMLCLIFLLAGICACESDIGFTNSEDDSGSQDSQVNDFINNVNDNNYDNQTDNGDFTESVEVFLDTPIDPEDRFLLENNHIPVSKDDYYQYSFLNDYEKELYRRIRVAVLSYDRVIELKDLNFSYYKIQNVFECFIADNPQYFWLTSSFAVTSDGALELIYTDGVTCDNGSVFAKNYKIDTQRELFNKAVYNIVSLIDPDASQYEKELAVHDCLIDLADYDYTASENFSFNGSMGVSYYSYGCIVEKEAVCSGYTKAFQYLCYLVGINSNVVYGDDHIWNTVKIDDEWYQVDLTWNDTTKSGNNHKYFNLTSSQMYSAHPRTTDSYYNCIKIPECSASVNSYH